MREHASEAAKIPTQVVTETKQPQTQTNQPLIPQEQPQVQNNSNNNPALPNIGNLSITPGLQNIAGMNTSLPTTSLPTSLPTTSFSGLPTSTLASTNPTQLNLPELNLNLPQIPGLPPLNLPSLDNIAKTTVASSPTVTAGAGDSTSTPTTINAGLPSSLAGLNLPNLNLPPLNLPSNLPPLNSTSTGQLDLNNIPGLPPLNLPSLSTTE